MADMTADSEAPLEVIPKTQAKKTATLTGDIKNDVYAAAAECVDAVMKRRASVNSAIFNSPFEVRTIHGAPVSALGDYSSEQL